MGKHRRVGRVVNSDQLRAGVVKREKRDADSPRQTVARNLGWYSRIQFDCGLTKVSSRGYRLRCTGSSFSRPRVPLVFASRAKRRLLGVSQCVSYEAVRPVFWIDCKYAINAAKRGVT